MTKEGCFLIIKAMSQLVVEFDLKVYQILINHRLKCFYG